MCQAYKENNFKNNLLYIISALHYNNRSKTADDDGNSYYDYDVDCCDYLRMDSKISQREQGEGRTLSYW